MRLLVRPGATADARRRDGGGCWRAYGAFQKVEGLRYSLFNAFLPALIFVYAFFTVSL